MVCLLSDLRTTLRRSGRLNDITAIGYGQTFIANSARIGQEASPGGKILMILSKDRPDRKSARNRVEVPQLDRLNDGDTLRGIG
jgi:hypothetical protein